MIETEVQARREKGLCFRCDEKFVPGHRCKKELQIMIVHEDEQEGDDEDEAEDITERMNQELEEGITETIKFSLNSVLSLTLPRTMKIKGRLETKDVMVLIDCGGNQQFFVS